MATDAQSIRLAEILSNEENDLEDRIDAAVFLMRADNRLAEERILGVVRRAQGESFDFQSELLDVVLGEWALQGKRREAECLFEELPAELSRYATAAWRNLIGLK